MNLVFVFLFLYIFNIQLISNSAEDGFPPFPYPVKTLEIINKKYPKIGPDTTFVVAQELAIIRAIHNYKCKCINGFEESALNFAASQFKVHLSHNHYYGWNAKTGAMFGVANKEDMDSLLIVVDAYGTAIFESLFDAIFGFNNLSLEKNFGSLAKVLELFSLIAEKKSAMMINANGFIHFGKLFKGTKYHINSDKCSAYSLIDLPSVDAIVQKLESHSLYFKYFDKLFGTIHFSKPLGVHFDVRLVDMIPQGIQAFFKIFYKKDLDLDKSKSLVSAAISTLGLKSVKL